MRAQMAFNWPDLCRLNEGMHCVTLANSQSVLRAQLRLAATVAPSGPWLTAEDRQRFPQREIWDATRSREVTDRLPPVRTH